MNNHQNVFATKTAESTTETAEFVQNSLISNGALAEVTKVTEDSFVVTAENGSEITVNVEAGIDLDHSWVATYRADGMNTTTNYVEVVFFIINQVR